MDTIVAATPFSKLLAELAPHDGIFYAAPGPEWRQGRTLFGGLSAALAVSAAKKAFADLPPLRAAQFAFVGPAAGNLEITPRIVRAGKSTTFVDVDIRSETDVALRATLMFGAARRSSHLYDALTMPVVAKPDDLADFFNHAAAPVFSAQFEARLAGGARIVSGAATPAVRIWLRHRDRSAPNDVASVVALGDVPPPAAMTMFASPAPISTATWSLEILKENFSPAGWHLIDIVADTVADGYSSQHATLWDEKGNALLAMRQCVAVFA
jgi:acyl-CoA thioesterase